MMPAAARGRDQSETLFATPAIMADRRADGSIILKSSTPLQPSARCIGDWLEHWARQGVLLLNNSLTVEEGRAGSHQNLGWEAITDAAVAAVAQREEPAVFLLWGSHARRKAGRVPGLMDGRHLVLTAPHPSPLSAYAGFFGCRHFSQANEFLEAKGRGGIDWQLPLS